MSVGKPAIGEFLKKLQIYKSTGDFETASKMFDKFSKVNEQWLQWREIVVSRKQPRKMKVQANTIIKGNFSQFSTNKHYFVINNDTIFRRWEADTGWLSLESPRSFSILEREMDFGRAKRNWWNPWCSGYTWFQAFQCLSYFWINTSFSYCVPGKLKQKYRIKGLIVVF